MELVILFGYILGFAVIPFVLLSGKRPVATLAWIWSILLFPYLGALTYLAIGTDRIKRRRLRRAARARVNLVPDPETSAVIIERAGPRGSFVRALANINQIPASTADEVDVLVDGRTFYPALLERIAHASRHIHIEFFIWRNDEETLPFLDALVAAAGRGVEVRLLLDQIGCFGVPTSYFQPLVEAGGKFSWFYSLPFNRKLRFLNLRNHRKLQIIDGIHAFVGGMNLGKEYVCKADWPPVWRDVQVEVRGPVVAQLQEVFAADWYFATEEKLLASKYYEPRNETGEHLCQIIAGGPDLPREPVPKSLITLLNFATKRAWISTGYFVPDSLLLSALQICAARGVDIRLIVSQVTDHRWLLEIGRSYYEDLLGFGVRVFEYKKGMNHAKAVLLDDDWLSIGSANFDNRSMRLNFELNLFLHCPPGAAILEKMMEEDFSYSQEIRLEHLQNRSFARRLRAAALRPLAPLM